MQRTIPLLLVFVSMSTNAAEYFDQVEHRYASNGDIKIHYAAAGPEDAPLIVMIHGFPDFWYTWRSQMEALQDRYRVAAMDLRGYNKSSQPQGVENYTMDILRTDVLQVIAAEGRTSAVVVGHDWGGAIAWNVTMYEPESVDLLVILNLPHPRGLARELANNPEQQRNSQYARNFQQPDAHKYLTAMGLAAWVRDEAARSRYVQAFESSNMESMLNYYKANYPRPGAAESGLAPPEMPSVKIPVLMFHGLEDTALLPGALSGTWEWIDSDLTLVTIPGASHFVQQDAPELINETMLDWLQRRVKN